jgi:hypothetical protein
MCFYLATNIYIEISVLKSGGNFSLWLKGGCRLWNHLNICVRTKINPRKPNEKKFVSFLFYFFLIKFSHLLFLKKNFINLSFNFLCEKKNTLKRHYQWGNLSLDFVRFLLGGLGLAWASNLLSKRRKKQW